MRYLRAVVLSLSLYLCPEFLDPRLWKKKKKILSPDSWELDSNSIAYNRGNLYPIPTIGQADSRQLFRPRWTENYPGNRTRIRKSVRAKED